MTWEIPLFKIYHDKDDINSIEKVIKRGSYWATGPEIEELEDNISKYIGKRYAVSFNSGTSALHCILLAHGINEGEVIVPSFTFISTANSVILAGAKPVFAEIEDETYGLEIEDVKEKINNKTKAILPIHYGGCTSKYIGDLKDIAKDNNLTLIEDAAESLGSKKGGAFAGTFGHSSMFSFCQNKIITSGEGGIILTDIKDIYQKLLLLRSHGRVEDVENYFSTTKDLDYIQLGYNFRMSSISAALALSQFNKIEKIIRMRREKAEYYHKKLSEIKNIKTPEVKSDFFHVYQMYTIQLKDKETRDMLQERLEKEKIMTKVYFNPIHLKSYYKKKFGYKKGDLPLTENISDKVLTIPIYPHMDKEEMDYVIEKIKENCE